MASNFLVKYLLKQVSNFLAERLSAKYISPVCKNTLGDKGLSASDGKPQATLRTKIEETLQQALEASFKIYSAKMNNFVRSTDNLLKSEKLERNHLEQRHFALTSFDRLASKLPDKLAMTTQEVKDALQNIINSYYLELKKHVKLRLAQAGAYHLTNDSVKLYTQMMENSMSQLLTEDHLTQRSKFCEKEATEYFLTKSHQQDEPFLKIQLANLKQRIAEMFKILKGIFIAKIEAIKSTEESFIENVKQDYNREMFKLLSGLNGNHGKTRSDLDELHVRMATNAINRISKPELNLSVNLRSHMEHSLHKCFYKFTEINSLLLECDASIIGIDLRTTNCCVCVYQAGHPVVKLNEHGSKTIPFYVSFDYKGDAKQIGQSAFDNAYQDQQSTVFNILKIIGKQYNDEKLQNEMRRWPFKIVNKGNKPDIMIGNRTHTPEKITSYFLKYLKQISQSSSNTSATKAVITVPSDFNEAQRNSILKAGQTAGLEVLKVVNSDVAVVTAYRNQMFKQGYDLDTERHILIFNFGSETFHVTVQKVTVDNIVVLESLGDTALGSGINDNLVHHCAKLFQIETGIDLFESEQKCFQSLYRLRRECERGQVALSSCSEVKICVNSIFLDKDLVVRVTRLEFEEMNMPIFQKVVDAINKVLENARVCTNDIDDVLLVGGCTRIPKIKEMVSECFGGRGFFSLIDPGEFAAAGAAIRAVQLTRQDVESNELDNSTIHITQGFGNRVDILIPKKTPKSSGIEKIYQTTADNQNSFHFLIFRGDDRDMDNNTVIHDFQLSGIPPAPDGQEAVEIHVYFDIKSTLYLTVSCKSTLVEEHVVLGQDTVEGNLHFLEF